ncbi:response regulator transcription factor [Amycolatopsis sp. Poz14]|uniref:response regulator transcription factor n=1 Tax=Amycolatopsis sp. Poz14 TaxID=1447705 RepID=UPI001EE91975|nr:response regulator transcription factor [Amycolatopsis sp. Poz14]MCG3751983.1 response regulator transcription factor [Amycolatopsis sp. Poz14]
MALVTADRVGADSALAPEERCQVQQVLVVDENELMLAGLRAVLSAEPWVESCLTAGSADAAWQVARRQNPQVVLVSTSLGGNSAMELCRTFKERMPHLRIVLLSGQGRMSAASAQLHGAAAALPKHMPAAGIVATVRRVADGAQVFAKDTTSALPEQLSQRELSVLQHLAMGLSNLEVAEALCLSRWTVKQHTSAVYRKLGVRNRAGAASRAQHLGLLP